jgi:CelD/BcsL family acetyltransferase involved in cellulose biosynthesis
MAMNDLTYGVNPHQSVAGMVAEYNAMQEKEAEEERKHEEALRNPGVNKDNERLIAKGRMNGETGMLVPLTEKAKTISRWIPSERFKSNFDAIHWNK